LIVTNLKKNKKLNLINYYQERVKKPKNRKKNNRKNRNMKKTKNRPVRFDFINLKPKKPNPNKKKPGKNPSKTGKKPSQTGKTEPNRFEPFLS